MALSSRHTSALPPAWRFGLVGAVASLPIAAVVTWLPTSEATIGGAFMIVGALIAGGIAATRSADPDAAGFRAGFIGGVVGVLVVLATVVGTALSGSTVGWPSVSRIAFIVLASGVSLCAAPLFGLAFGRISGWAANRVLTR